jgi:propionate CoA-transferase
VQSKILSADAAARLVKTGDTITLSGNSYQLFPDRILEAIERRYLEEGLPRDLTEFHPVVVGRAAGAGLERLAHEGLIARYIGASYSIWGMDRMNQMINTGKVHAYALPMGTCYHLLRAIANRAPGVLTDVGMHTFVDPRSEGGRLNAATPPGVVELVSFAGREYLFYPSFPIDVAIIQASYADEDGNLSVENSPVSLGIRLQAMAAKRCGGKVIAQVRNVVARGSIHPRRVEVPAHLVDAIVVDPGQKQQLGETDDPTITGEARAPLASIEAMAPGMQKIIVRRAALELKPGSFVNIGFGIGVDLPRIAVEEGISDRVTFTTEHGGLGGLPIDADNFGAHVNPAAIIESAAMFDIYHAGCLDMAFLSLAEVDAEGNVNVSRFGNMRAACGGFHDIAEYTPKIVFCGTFTAKGAQVAIEGGRLRIVKEGAVRKFVDRVQQVTLNGRWAAKKGQEVLYVTERAVFRLTEDGPLLVEIAPGISIDRDIRPHAGFEIKVAGDLAVMDERLFRDEPMDLARSFAQPPANAMETK